MINHLTGRDVADALIGHSPTGTVHAVRPAQDVWLVSIPADEQQRPAVAVALHHLATRDEARGHHVIPHSIASRVVDAITNRDDEALMRLVAAHLNSSTKKKEQ